MFNSNDIFPEMFQTKDVTEWTETFRAVDLPDLRLTFAGLFGHLLLLQFDFNTTLAITSPLIGGLEATRTTVLIEDLTYVFYTYQSRGLLEK